MKRKLKSSERTMLFAVAGVVVLIFLLMLWINPMRESIRALKNKVKTRETFLLEAIRLKQQYIQFEKDITTYSEIIERRRDDFSLMRYITDLEGELGFHNIVQHRPDEKKLGPEYIKTTIEYKYTRKSLDEIIKYLYEIENPDNAIIIESFHLIPNISAKERGKIFDLRRIELSVVTKNRKRD